MGGSTLHSGCCRVGGRCRPLRRIPIRACSQPRCKCPPCRSAPPRRRGHNDRNASRRAGCRCTLLHTRRAPEDTPILRRGRGRNALPSTLAQTHKHCRTHRSCADRWPCSRNAPRKRASPPGMDHHRHPRRPRRARASRQDGTSPPCRAYRWDRSCHSRRSDHGRWRCRRSGRRSALAPSDMASSRRPSARESRTDRHRTPDPRGRNCHTRHSCPCCRGGRRRRHRTG